jgi:hypothetical protein
MTFSASTRSWRATHRPAASGTPPQRSAARPSPQTRSARVPPAICDAMASRSAATRECPVTSVVTTASLSIPARPDNPAGLDGYRVNRHRHQHRVRTADEPNCAAGASAAAVTPPGQHPDIGRASRSVCMSGAARIPAGHTDSRQSRRTPRCRLSRADQAVEHRCRPRDGSGCQDGVHVCTVARRQVRIRPLEQPYRDRLLRCSVPRIRSDETS